MIGFDFGLALRQNSTLRVPRRGPSSCGASCASGAVFYFAVNFFPTGVSTLLIKAEIWVCKDVQVSLPSSLTKPWPSQCFKKHMDGLKFRVSHKICWFHKYRKVKRGLSTVFTFLQCLQEQEKEDVKKFASNSMGQSSAGSPPWWEYATQRAAMVWPWPALCCQGFQELLAHCSSPFLAFICVTVCVEREKKQKIKLNKMQELRKKWNNM